MSKPLKCSSCGIGNVKLYVSAARAVYAEGGYGPLEATPSHSVYRCSCCLTEFNEHEIESMQRGG